MPALHTSNCKHAKCEYSKLPDHWCSFPCYKYSWRDHAVTLEKLWHHPFHCWPCSHISVFSCLASGSTASGHLWLLLVREVLWQSLDHSVVCMVQSSPLCVPSDLDVPLFCTLQIIIRVQYLTFQCSFIRCKCFNITYIFIRAANILKNSEQLSLTN